MCTCNGLVHQSSLPTSRNDMSAGVHVTKTSAHPCPCSYPAALVFKQFQGVHMVRNLPQRSSATMIICVIWA
eukprot:9487332-Pyramimonas_sp.AAC.1